MKHTVSIPAKLADMLNERNTYADAPSVTVRYAGNRARLTGEHADMAYVGDYIFSLADLVRTRAITAAEMGYGAAKLDEVAKRFPLNRKAAAPKPARKPGAALSSVWMA